MLKYFYCYLLLFIIFGCSRKSIPDGIYLISNLAGDSESAIPLIGQAAKNYNKSQKENGPGTTLITVDATSNGSRLLKKSDEIVPRIFDGGNLEISTKLNKSTFAFLDGKHLNFKANIGYHKIEGVKITVSKIDSFIYIKGTLETLNSIICDHRANVYSGDFRISKDNGRNYIDRLFKAQGELEITLNDTLGVTAMATVTAAGGKIAEKIIKYRFPSTWAFADVVNLESNHCKLLANQHVLQGASNQNK